MFCMTISSCSRCKIVSTKYRLLQVGMLRGKMANSLTCPTPKLTKISLTDKLRAHTVTCMTHRLCKIVIIVYTNADSSPSPVRQLAQSSPTYYACCTRGTHYRGTK